MSHLIAHRGRSAVAPENTLAAFQAAADAGFDWIETDVDLLADGTPVLFHDETLERTTDATGPLAALTRQDLAGIDAGSWRGECFRGERIPTLDQLMELLEATGTGVNLELKLSDPTPQRAKALHRVVLDAVQRLAPRVPVLLSSFQHELLAALHQDGVAAPLACLFEPHTLSAEHPETWQEAVEHTGATAVNPSHGDLDLGLARQILEAGLGLNAWTVNEPLLREELEQWGVQGIVTDGGPAMLEPAAATAGETAR